MGGASSKAARRLPKDMSSRTGARAPASPHPAPSAPRTHAPLASEFKSEEIQRDAQDPQFMAKLNSLGPVKVDHHMKDFRAAGNMNSILNTRRQADSEASSPRQPRNHLLAPSLSELLEERKHVSSQAQLEQLAARYNLDVEKLESVARFVNAVGVDERNPIVVQAEHGEEKVFKV
ncbi:hypothetical protein JAAARDRAFT_127116 [Jaapia argillacea MUCL 33604]|uniref:Uncharacterized protein n=1 Tax=Jaapia argillacea MUCL 33604 TaxID=933084 RepID=A0A067PXM3_9AGAM|nr:hypothetical protein JAAARDRAFT_127116 [Jaapia argillacea MUCL 33604]